nr:immunoglobulin heavy chain junction region [Mus musculus]
KTLEFITAQAMMVTT